MRRTPAEQAYKQDMAIKKKSLPPDHPDLAASYTSLGILYQDQGRYAEAESLLDQAIAIADRHRETPDLRFRAYWSRATLAWKTHRREQAVMDLKQALDTIEWLRGHAAGEELHRAGFFAGILFPFELMVSWQTELGDAAEVLAAMERSRARTLLEQMETQGMDLLAGVPQAEAARLRRAEQEAQGRAAAVQKQLELVTQRKDLPDAERNRKNQELETQLRQAQQEHFLARAEVRNASPAYRLAIGQDRKPVDLDKIGTWTVQHGTLVLEYLIGIDGAYVLVLPADGKPRVERLTLNAQQAGALSTQAGPLTSKLLAGMLSNDKKTGLLQLLRDADTPEKTKAIAPSLAHLWEILVPTAERDAILAGKYKLLVVLPDAALAQLSFETLVVEAGDNPQFLLDVGPPILYAPSATILMNLTDRQAKASPRGTKPVLTVADCRYNQTTPTDNNSLLAQLTPKSRYVRGDRRLLPLQHSGTESGWVAHVFQESKVPVDQLLAAHTTEANVRSNIPGRRVVHFACHGLVDQSYGNLFGALALTPGANGQDAANDGFLTLAEIYELNAKGCELTILSACDTNVGPEQRGEGVWSLARGFLVAGSRRVVASNWLVDDEAAASMISYFCGSIAQAEGRGETPDYAASLHAAKQWVRQQEKWQSPYYWASFVLIGPR